MLTTAYKFSFLESDYLYSILKPKIVFCVVTDFQNVTTPF